MNMREIDCVDFCRAMGDTTRQKLLKLLQQEGEQCVGCLVERFGLAQPTISHHLLLLKRAGLVKSRKAGKQVYYAIDQDNVVECCGMLMTTFTPPAAHTVAIPIVLDEPTVAPRPAFAGERDTK
jgi:ArsR family transcriptional regulator